MNATPIGPHDTVIGVAFLSGAVGGILLIAGELTDASTVSAVAVALLAVGLLLATVGGVMASRAGGRGFIRSLASGARASVQFVFDFF